MTELLILGDLFSIIYIALQRTLLFPPSVLEDVKAAFFLQFEYGTCYWYSVWGTCSSRNQLIRKHYYFWYKS